MRHHGSEAIACLWGLLCACGDGGQGGGADGGKSFDMAVNGLPDLASSDESMESTTDLHQPDILPGGRLIFVTEDRFGGDLRTAGGAMTGLDSADALCARAADNGGLGGKWVAWLSDEATSAIDRIVDVGPWYSLDGQKLFENRAGMAQEAFAPVGLSELGHLPVSCQNLDRDECKAWTATMMGVRDTGSTCSHWTTTSAMKSAWVGSALSNFGWLGGHWDPCTEKNHLFCVQQ